MAELPGVTFQIVSLEATPRSGSTRVAVTLRASSDDRPNVSVQISGSALLLLQEVRHDAEQGSDTATFASVSYTHLDVYKRQFFFLIHVKAFVQLWQKNMLVDIEGRRLMRACRLCGTKLRGNSDKCAHI